MSTPDPSPDGPRPDDPARGPTDLTQLLRAARAGDTGASDALLPLVQDELRGLAAGYLAREDAGHTLQPTALVNEAYLRLFGERGVDANDREHFLALAARTMRRVLVDHARRKLADKRGSGAGRVTLLTSVESDAGADRLDLLALDEALERFAAVDARAAKVVELRFFGGLSVDEIAAALGVSDRTVDNDWFVARGWLKRALSDVEDQA